MKAATGKPPRTRARIIAELASPPSAIQGKTCGDKRELANGATVVDAAARSMERDGIACTSILGALGILAAFLK